MSFPSDNHLVVMVTSVLITKEIILYRIAAISGPLQKPLLPDSSPIQRPEPSWSKKQITLDHIHMHQCCYSNDISDNEASYISTLFESLDIQVSHSTILQVTHSGQRVTFLNLSFFKPNNTYKCLNEIKCWFLSLLLIHIISKINKSTA